jgi:KDO2-lipid IV(A) lauroyltransferase
MDRKRLRRLRWPFSYAAYRLLAGLVCALPSGALPPLARLGGALLYLVPGFRRILHANLAIAFPARPEPGRRALARQSLRYLLLSYLEFLWYSARPAAIARRVHIPPAVAEQLHAYRADRRGAALLSPHLGNWELGNLALNTAGLPTSAVARKLTNPYLERAFTAARTATGAQIIHEKGAVKGMLRALRDQRLLCLLVDQNTRPRHGGMFVPFFGLPATMSRAPALLTRRGAALATIACLRQPDGTFTVHLHPLLPAGGTDLTDEAIGALINQATEQLLAEFPEQYLWLYERWRYFPPGQDHRRPRYPLYADTYRDYRHQFPQKTTPTPPHPG